ncbi:MAG: hypothetical protein LBR74_04455 [Eubacterium sp.]|jgi:flagellar basal-body rod modification protein FlgD|nr:hypothetical protein [Eubacterium sp.]
MPVDSLGSIKDNYVKFADRFESDSSKDTVTMDTFYKLLTAEMTNQDPLEPMSNTEFISQMASFTSLKTQTDSLYYSNANYAQSLVGKTVTIAFASGEDVKSESGVVTSMNVQDGKFQVKVNGNYYDMSNVMEILPSVNPFTVSGTDGAFGTSLIGKQVTVETVNESGLKVADMGVVSHIEILNNEIKVIVNNLAYPISSVVKVDNAQGSAEEDDVTRASAADISYASALIGKKVTVADGEINDLKYSGTVDGVDVDAGKVYILVNGDRHLISSILKVEESDKGDDEAIETPVTDESEAPYESADPSDIETKPAENTTNSNDVETKPSENTTNPNDVETKPAENMTNPNDFETKPGEGTDISIVETKPIEGGPETIETSDQVPVETQPADIKTSDYDDTEELNRLFGLTG